MPARILLRSLASALALASASTITIAADFDVSIENISRGLYFTPLVVAAHTADARLFELGESATAELQAMAEGGDISGLETLLNSIGATQANNPAAGLLFPGASTLATLNTDNATANTKLSVVAMILPSNDGFVGLNAIDIPTVPGTYSYYVSAYDAGTEANDEVRGSGASGEPGFPVPGPLEDSVGVNGTGLITEVEGFVHVHRGNLGDTDSTGGNSDIDSQVHRWLNPVAKITLTVR